VVTTDSSTNCSCPGSTCLTLLRIDRRFDLTSDRLRSSACCDFSLRVWPRRRRARQIVVRLLVKPLRCLSMGFQYDGRIKRLSGS
jgi:hypothetical protein